MKRKIYVKTDLASYLGSHLWNFTCRGESCAACKYRFTCFTDNEPIVIVDRVLWDKLQSACDGIECPITMQRRARVLVMQYILV